MNGRINGQNGRTQGVESTNYTFDWVIDSLVWLEPSIIIDVPGISDPLDLQRSPGSLEDSVFGLETDASPIPEDRDDLSDSLISGVALAENGRTQTYEKVELKPVWTSSNTGPSWPHNSAAHTPHDLVLDATPAVQLQNGGIFGLNGDTDAVGTDGDDVFFEVKFITDDNMPDGWSAWRSKFEGKGGDDIFYTVDGLGYRGEEADLLVDTFNGGRGTDTVSYISAHTGAAINLEEGLGYRFGQNWTHPGQLLGERDVLISIENAVGSHHADRIRGDWKDNVLHGLGGDDVMWGGLGDDTMHGGAGDDVMYGEDHDDLMYGDDGDDRLWGSAGDDEIHGGAGDDDVSGGIGDDSIRGDAGEDELYGHEGADTIRGGEGDDTIRGGSGDDELHGEGGENNIRGGWGQDRITLGDGGAAWGDQGEDVIHGSNTRDLIHGGEHDDELFGWGGNDHMSGDAGDDNIYGGDGFDTASYASATSSVGVFLSDHGGFASGGGGNDQLFSIESVVGSTYGDVISGNDGFNTLLGGLGDDIIAGNGGLDIIKGEGGNDDLRGGSGGDIMLGGDGRDKMSGGSGYDAMSGGDGDDRIRGGDGLDELTGGAGADLFVFVGGDTGADTITDFELDTDRIIFDDFLANAPGIGESYVGEVYAFFADQLGDSALMARAEDGWQHVATFEGIGVGMLSDAIADGSLFHGSSDGLGGGPGELIPVAGDHLPIVLGDDLMFG